MRELHGRTPDASTRYFELTEIAQHASRLDPDFDPWTRFERVLMWFGVEVDEDPEALRDRERAYLGRRGEAGSIMKELVETGQVAKVPIAPVLLLEAGSGYGKNANENGMLYAFPQPALETVG